MPVGRRPARIVACAGIGVLLVAGCTGEPEPDIDDLGRTLTRDGNNLLEEAKVMAPVNYDGRITFLDQPATRNVPCAEEGTVKRVFKGHGVGEWGSPARVGITGDTLLGILVQQDYELDQERARPLRYTLRLSKSDGDLRWRVVVDDGEPMRWRAVGETRCVSSS
jgi:hypothetical protein